MHEMGVTRDIVDAVIKHAEEAGATSVRTVFLRIGFVRDIVDELLDSCFKWMARGTILEGAEVVIERVPLTVRCNSCGTIYHIEPCDEASLPCPTCHKRDYRIHTGMELEIASIECVFSRGVVNVDERLAATA